MPEAPLEVATPVKKLPLPVKAVKLLRGLRGRVEAAAPDRS
jgi:hypothetical protein